MPAKLLAILQVEKEQRVQCQQPGCAHGVYRAIHVIEEDAKLSVLGSTCFKKKFGRADALGKALYGGGNGRQLTADERQMLIDNTAALLEKLELEHQRQTQLVRDKLSALYAEFHKRKQPVASPMPPEGPELFGIPWKWAKSMPSIAYFRMKDGTSWVRVPHKDGFHMLMPWPWFDGWDEVLPASIGTAEQELGGIKVTQAGIANAVGYLKDRATTMQVGIWRDIFGNQRQRQ